MPKPSSPLLHEWMHRFEIDGLIVRVWTKAKREVDYHEQQNQAEELKRELQTYLLEDDLDIVARRFAYINAIEVLDSDGNGRLVYVDWP